MSLSVLSPAEKSRVRDYCQTIRILRISPLPQLIAH